MKQQPLQVTCSFSKEGDVREILFQSFRLYLNRRLAEGREVAYPVHDE